MCAGNKEFVLTLTLRTRMARPEKSVPPGVRKNLMK